MSLPFAQLAGSHASGTIQIAESAINELLHLAAPGRADKATLELLPRNRVVVRAGIFHAHAELPSAIGPRALPHITFRLASVLVAWGLKAFVHAPFVHIHGRSLTIDLVAVPAPEPWHEAWRHLQQLTFATVPGALQIGFVIAVQSGATAPGEQGSAHD
jgi:hypothetical protein